VSDPRRASGPPLRPASGQRLRIAGIEYDPEDRSFTRRGERLPLLGKPLELAEYMLASGSRTHSIAELKDAVWRGTAVSDNSVYKAVSKVRDALGPGVISTRRKLGFQLAAAPVATAPPSTLPDAARASLGDDGPFVGQEVLLADLVRHLDAARAGRGRLVCLRGETGAGKTRVAAELARLGREAGVEAHWGGFADPAAGAQRHPWQELAASVRARAGSDEPPTQVYGVDLTAEGPAAFADAAFEALSRTAAVAPRLLLIDDAQWIDPEAAQRIHAIAERIASLPAMLLVLIRSPGLAGAAPEEHLGRIQRLAADSLTVPSLREEDVRALVLHALGEASGALAGEIRRRTDGNAYFATELIRWIRNAGERPELRDARVLPETIRSAIESRLAVLPRPASDILCYAATVGHEIDLALLRRSRRWTAAELSEAVALFEREGLLRRIDPDDPEELRFEHHLVREVAALRLAGRAEEIHWEIGEIAEELYGDALAASTLVARHMARGVEVGDARRAVAALRRAALASMRAFAHGRAAEHLRAALRIARGQSGAERERAEILLELGRALLRAGSLEEAAKAFQDTAQIAEALSEPTLLGRAALGFSGAAATVGGAHGPALELVRTALARLGGGEEALRVRLQSREALLEDALGRQDSAAGLAERAVALAEALRDPKGLATAYRVRNTVGVSRVHDAGPRVAFATKTLDFAVASGDVSLEVDALIHRGVAELHRGAVSAARRDFREARGSLRDRPPTPASYPVEVASVLLASCAGPRPRGR
jgi:DNA-binding winged helix-turn-helix (wHTH) protein/tetratricopeptide (TPR) repeat protein